ncbi:MAG: putative dsRNA-binding protein, partial [Burkholderiaceae bacterium]|nr:putative dsRNA-binding protein [Burkholderiaceae bacterium]
VVETRGAAHNQEFEVECAIPKLEISVRGNGRSRRAAEQTAAKLALDQAHAALSAARRAKRKPVSTPDSDVGDATASGVGPTPQATAADGPAAPKPMPATSESPAAPATAKAAARQDEPAVADAAPVPTPVRTPS